MTTILYVDSDPTGWYIEDGSLTLSQLTGSDQVLSVPVLHPVRGTLLLSPSAFGSIVLTGPPPGTEGMPSDADVQTPQVYLPSATGITDNWSGYPLSDNPADTQNRILQAMGTGDMISIAIGSLLSAGQVFLNGATLSFVVLCEPRASGAAVLSAPSEIEYAAA
jgi:hypothetical protein